MEKVAAFSGSQVAQFFEGRCVTRDKQTKSMVTTFDLKTRELGGKYECSMIMVFPAALEVREDSGRNNVRGASKWKRTASNIRQSCRWDFCKVNIVSQAAGYIVLIGVDAHSSLPPSGISAIPEEPCPNSSNPASTGISVIDYQSLHHCYLLLSKDTGAVVNPSPSHTMGEGETRANSDAVRGSQSPANSHSSSCHSALSGSGCSSVSGRAGLTTVTRRSSTMTKHSGIQQTLMNVVECLPWVKLRFTCFFFWRIHLLLGLRLVRKSVSMHTYGSRKWRRSRECS